MTIDEPTLPPYGQAPASRPYGSERSASSGNPFRAILDVGAALVSSLVLDDVFLNVARRIGEAMVVWGVDIQTYDRETMTLRRQAGWCLDAGKAGELAVIDHATPLGDRPWLGDVVLRRQLVDRRTDDPALSPAERRFMEERAYKAVLTAPLAIGDTVLGALSLVERRFARRFTPIEIDLFRQLCDLASVAIHNAGLYERMDEQKRHMGSLLEASRALTSSLVLEEVMTIVAPCVAQALGVDSADIYEFDADADTLVCVASWVADDPQAAEDYLGTLLPLAEHRSFERVLEAPRVIEYHIDDPLVPQLDRELYDEMRRWGEKSVIEAGVFFGAEATGCISLCARDRVRTLSEDERELLLALASSASMAIHNAKTFRRQEEQTRHLGSLLDAGRSITATVELEEVLARVADEASRALRTAQAAVYEYDAVDDTYIFHAFSEVDPTTEGEDWLGEAYPMSENPTDRDTLRSRRPKVEHLSDPDLPADRRINLEAYGEKTVLSIPLHFGETPLGILRLYETERERLFTPAEIELAAGLGEQAAIAINNARLYRELREQKRHLDSVLRIGRALASSADADDLCATIVATGAEAFGAPRALIYEYDETDDTLTPRSLFERDHIQGYDTSGVPQALGEMPGDREILDGRRPVAEHVSDLTLDPATRNEMRRWGEKTCLNVPLVLQDRPLGILMLIWTEQERRLTPAEMELAMGVGEQAAIGLRNACVVGAAIDLRDTRDDA
jgi:GAF domain-containing protein